MTTNGTRWASCSAREFGHIGLVSHAVPKGALTTVCSATATHSNIWRAAPRKPRCAACVEALAKRA